MPARTCSAPLVELSLAAHSATPRTYGPGERPIDRSLLLDISPDREALLMSNDIQRIRDALKIHPSELGSE